MQSTQFTNFRVRDMQNLISFRDKEIADIQEQLKSIKNVKKLQDRSKYKFYARNYIRTRKLGCQRQDINL